MDNLRFDQLRGAFAVSRHLHRKLPAQREQRAVEKRVAFILFRDLPVFGLAVCEHKKRVVRRGIPVDRDHIEGIVNNPADRLLKETFLNVGIRRNIAEHGAHIRMNHARALRHAADRDRHRAVSVRCRKLDFISKFLIDGIGRHDRLRGFRSGLGAFGKRRVEHADAPLDSLNRNLHADDARRADQYGFFGNAEHLRSDFSGLFADFHAFLAGSGIRNPGIDNHGTGLLAGPHNLTVPQNRSRLDHILRKCSGNRTRLL